MAKMIIDMKLPIRLLALVVMLSLLSCWDKSPPVSQSPKPVSQKITPQAAVAEKPSQEVTIKPSETETDEVQPDVQPVEVEAGEAQSEEPKSSSDLVQASLNELASAYDPKGRFDPFEPLFKDEPETDLARDKKSQHRIPQTPLERIALGQLKLSAIIRGPSGNRALVEDATGKGYVVSNGTFMGLNSGKVVQIGKDRIIVEEEIENVLGEATLKNTELKLQKPAGEL